MSTQSHTIRIIDVDSPFMLGLGRDMTDEERKFAERHGRFGNPPMSVLGVTHEGLAAVADKDLAHLFAAAPDYQSATAYLVISSYLDGKYWPEEIMEWAKGLMRGEKRTGVEIVRAAIAKATGEEGA